jgi:Xaa-Pro aminopeptidase
LDVTGHGGAPNDKRMADGDLVLFDMSCEYYTYGSGMSPQSIVIGNGCYEGSGIEPSATSGGGVCLAVLVLRCLDQQEMRDGALVRFDMSCAYYRYGSGACKRVWLGSC